ncbi:hypothetical protein [uncultured Lamprocystis sp.]|uniref:hypothetical protein n=1 Tax=uncultured Lamprocystis sp. TaxID=543132 RepID=UPI0025DAB6EE|nr:hypothetical protein [uncultured Lamprocystis sp.]
MKYIVLQTGDGECPVLFTKEFSHRYMAGLFAPMPVVAAGVVREVQDGLSCGGGSGGLRTSSRYGLDTALIREALGED